MKYFLSHCYRPMFFCLALYAMISSGVARIRIPGLLATFNIKGEIYETYVTEAGRIQLVLEYVDGKISTRTLSQALLKGTEYDGVPEAMLVKVRDCRTGNSCVETPLKGVYAGRAPSF